VRPLRLTLSGFRSFRAEQTIDFSNLGLFAVVGDTGAGKSSILEAIVYALYNKTTWDERGVKALIALDADTMRVDLDFSDGTRTYRVTRSASRLPGRPSLHALTCAEDSSNRFDGEQGVNAEIIRVTGIAYETFVKTVVLPQGRFADLLTARDAERNTTLTQLLGLDEIDRIREVIEVPRTQARERLAGLQATLSGLGDPAARIPPLRVEFERLEREIERLDLLLRKVENAAAECRAMQRRGATFGAAMKDLKALEAQASALMNLAPLAAEFEALLVAADERRVAAEAEQKAGQALEADLRTRGMDAIALASARAILQQLQRSQEAIAETTRTLAWDADQIEQRALHLEHKRGDLDHVAAERAGVSHRLREADELSKFAAECERLGLEAWKQLLVARSEVDRRRAALASTEMARAVDAAAVDAAAALLIESETCAREARAALHAAQHANAAALLGRELHPGEPCPVCAQAVPGGFVAAPAPDLARAEKACHRADTAATGAAAELAGQRERVSIGDRALQDATEALADASSALGGAVVAASAAGVETGASDEADALAHLRTAAKDAAAAADGASRTNAALERRWLQLQAELTAQEGSLQDVRSRHQAGMEKLDRERQEIESARLALRDELRPATITQAAFRECLQRLEAAAVAAREVAERNAGAGTALWNAQSAIYDITQRYAKRIAEPATTALAGSDHLLGSLRANEEVSAYEAAPRRPAEGIDNGIAWASGLAVWCARLDRDLGSAYSELQDTLQSTAAVSTELLVQAGASSVEELRNLLACVRQEFGGISERLARFEQDLVKAHDAQQRIAVVEPLSQALERLRRYLQNDEFKNHLMRLRERRLLGVATDVLRKMTDGRYAFAEGFQILDGLTQQSRDPRTLSGGEKFLASLALALGLVEIASQAGGRLDALFLDEGFGSLDPNALDAALAELAGRAGSGKMIGVITHVRSLAVEIETILRVRRLPGGSTVARLTPNEREEMQADANAGLVEVVG